ncbi:MAG: zinc metallopeptidase [Bacteroidales bacterium]|nr:zinc metallopeptidase [Bacteroidales bacterium]
MNIWAIIILVMAVSYLIQMVLDRRISKYSQIGIQMSGAEVAKKMLAEHGIGNVSVTCTPGRLTDHFDPTTMTVNLSESVYSGRNIAAAAIAAHECGHAVQHATGYAPIRMRSALVPVVSFASKAVQWVLLLGVIVMSYTPYLLWVGIALFGMTTLFSLITLPVEINASRRAVEWLDWASVTNYETAPMARDALKWAAYTYVVAALGSLATLLYYVGMARRN